ncbi:hypothetical protein ACIRBX_12060 [Kitasatospora sp. NPDC096147]|uniref:hypothetical protein n=1 Tax=Kitasatospora sp. NPDC096147 TaxID=3364093 RepID=UPI0038127797
MSMIKQYIEDHTHLTGRAVGVARIADDGERWRKLTELFGGCGELASKYPFPEPVAAVFVERVVKVFQAERALLRRPLPELAA